MFVDRHGVPKKYFFSYNLILRPNIHLTYSRWAIFLAKYNTSSARGKDFADQSQTQHLLTQLSPFDARKVVEAEYAQSLR